MVVDDGYGADGDVEPEDIYCGDSDTYRESDDKFQYELGDEEKIDEGEKSSDGAWLSQALESLDEISLSSGMLQNVCSRLCLQVQIRMRSPCSGMARDQVDRYRTAYVHGESDGLL